MKSHPSCHEAHRHAGGRQAAVEFTLMLDRPRVLRITAATIERILSSVGIKISALPRLVGTREGIVLLIWAAAAETDPAVTLEQLRPHVTLEVARNFAGHLQQASAFRAMHGAN